MLTRRSLDVVSSTSLLGHPHQGWFFLTLHFTTFICFAFFFTPIHWPLLYPFACLGQSPCYQTDCICSSRLIKTRKSVECFCPTSKSCPSLSILYVRFSSFRIRRCVKCISGMFQLRRLVGTPNVSILSILQQSTASIVTDSHHIGIFFLVLCDYDRFIYCH